MVKLSNAKFQISLLLVGLFSAASARHSAPLFAQQPQAQSGQPIYAANAKYVNGVAPGYWPTAGSGLTLNLTAGTSLCGTPAAPVYYAGGTLTMGASATNYVFVNISSSYCAPTSNTTSFPNSFSPIAVVTTGSGAITGIQDLRLTSSGMLSVPSIVSCTSSPCSDPGGALVYLMNNTSGAMTFSSPGGVQGYQRCYSQGVGQTGVLTISAASNNLIALNGVNATGLSSAGAAGDAGCMYSDATNHWTFQPSAGNWYTGLVGHWKLAEGGGSTAFDSSGQGNNATWQGSKTGSVGYYSLGMVSPLAGVFDGSTNYVNGSNASILSFQYNTPFSITAWVRTSNTSSDGFIFAKALNSGNYTGYYLNISNTSGGCTGESSGKGLPTFALISSLGALLQVQASTSVNDGGWHHVAFAYSGNSAPSGITGYVDGVSQSLTTCNNSLGSNTIQSSAPFTVGSRQSGGAMFTGQISDARVYNRVLGATEIAQLYQSPH
jgi:hypothetical protein